MINLRIVFSTLLVLFAFNSFGQIQAPPKWTYTFDASEVKVGDEVELIFKADIPQNWYIYSNDFDKDLGPTLTTVKLEAHPSFEIIGELMPIDPSRKYDEVWAGEISYFMGKGEFRQRIRILQNDLKILGNIDYQMCIEMPNDSRCIPFDEDFTFPAISISGTANEETANAGESDSAESEEQITPPIIEDTIPTETRQTIPLEPIDANGNTGEMSLWAFMVLCFLGGVAALLTPCVYPMIPLTVSFFTGKSKSRRQALIQAFFYGFSIIAIYTISGTIVAKVSGPEFANWLSTHWVPNVAFFAIFIFFALAFLGMFEITLPSSWVNNADKQADKGGYYGTFFMAFTLVLVSFSCTGPIVGTILVESAGGLVLKPILGMFAFSMAFAIPFTLFAIFPEWLNSLPRSGGWMNTVKVVLGFLELALAFKFLSIADQVYHWGILDRDIFLVIWIAVFIGLTIYLFGFIRMPHDDKVEKLGVPRLLLALTSLGFVIYLMPGLWGAPLKGLAGYLPPMKSNMFTFAGGNTAYTDGENQLCDIPKYADLFELPHGLQGYFDYEQALACAKSQGKPLFIDFTGHGCVNCREMEARVWSDPAVLKRLREYFVIVALYVDDKSTLPENQWYISEYDNKEKKSIGKQNADFQITRYNNNAQPYYVILDHKEELLIQPKAYDLNPVNFVAFLDEAKASFDSNR